jgi:hypothetical protein
MIFGGLLDVVVVVFLVLVFAEYIKLRAKVDKPMKFLAGAAMLFLLAWSFGGLTVFGYAGAAAAYGTQLFEILGWILLLVATLWGTLELIKK